MASETYQNSVHGIIAGIPMPWPGFDTDFCGKLSQGDCPVDAGETVTYTNSLVIDASYPKVRGKRLQKCLLS